MFPAHKAVKVFVIFTYFISVPLYILIYFVFPRFRQPMEGDISIILSRFRHHHDPCLGSSLEIHILNLLSFAGFEWAAAPYKMIPLQETGLVHRLRWKVVAILSKQRRKRKNGYLNKLMLVCFVFNFFFFFLGSGKVEFCRHYKTSPQTSDITEEIHYYLFYSFVHVFIFIP